MISKLELGVFDQFILIYDIICLSETKYKSIDNNYLSEFSRYDHPKGGIHGNSILIKNTLQTESIQIEGTDSLCVNWLLVKNYNFILGAVYIPPSNSEYYNDDLFHDIIDDMSYITSIYDKPFVMIGDFNSRTIVMGWIMI